MVNKFKKMLHAKEPSLGFWLNFPSPDLAEFVGIAGFDFIIIDTEHYFFGPETVLNIVRAAKGAGCAPICRVAANDPALILGYLEAGVEGIIVPHVNTAEEAKKIVRAVKYPPMGIRGANSVTRVSNYGFTQSPQEFFEAANCETLVIAMVEEVEAMANLPEILLVEGLDTVFIGPEDLSASMGFVGQPEHPEVQAVIQDAEAKILAAGKPLGRLGATSQAASKAFSEGVTYFALFFPAYLGNQLRSFINEAKKSKE